MRARALTGIENGYRPGASGSAASITARPSSGSTSHTTKTDSPDSPMRTLSPTSTMDRSLIESVFDTWSDEFSAPLRRVLDPPIPVLVNWSVALAEPSAGFRRDGLSMRTKAAGLDTTATVPGQLHCWARTTTGAWIGLVTTAIPTGNRGGYVQTRQWCPAPALTPNDPESGASR